MKTDLFFYFFGAFLCKGAKKAIFVREMWYDLIHDWLKYSRNFS